MYTTLNLFRNVDSNLTKGYSLKVTHTQSIFERKKRKKYMMRERERDVRG